MSNHYHLVVETPEGNLSKGMRQLNGVYTQYVNRAHGRVGHVFQGRYTGILVEKESYLLELTRYVVLNPVRAGMVDDPRAWPWSSYRAMVGEAASFACYLGVVPPMLPKQGALTNTYNMHIFGRWTLNGTLPRQGQTSQSMELAFLM